MEVYTVNNKDDAKDMSVKDPLIINVDGRNYYVGKRGISFHILIWPYQRPKISAGGIYASVGQRDSDPYTQRFGKVLEVGLNCYPKEFYPYGQECHVGDWVLYRRYENQIWGHSWGAVLKEDGSYEISNESVEEITISKIQPQFIVHNFGPDLDPARIDSSKHIGR